MKSSQRMRIILLALVLLLILGVAGNKLASHEIVRCYFIEWSDLEKIGPDLYVDPNMPDSQKQVLQALLADAKDRVAALYGEYSANPVIIAGHTMEVMETYGGNLYNRVGRASFTPLASFIVLGPGGIISLDVLSHELAHAELSARIGYWNRGKIPNWFDEGLAVNFDERYSEAEWRTRTDDGRMAYDLDQIGIIAHDDRLGYLTAKHEVQRWLDIVGQEGFWALLHEIRNGEDFQEFYQSIEQTYSTIK